MKPEEIRKQLEFFRDLGFTELYDRPPVTAVPAKENSVPATETAAAQIPGTPAPAPEPNALPLLTAKEVLLPSMTPVDDTLDAIRADMGDCRRCPLHVGRNKIVFGTGNQEAKIVFVGEGPGADEDQQGIPFVGRAGQLLTQMIEGTAKKEGIPLARADVYICNVVKCRPPENRTPEPVEMSTCGQFLFRQLSVVRPKAICALGSTAAKALLGGKDGVTKLRGRWHKWKDIPLLVTYHPSYLLRPYNQSAKREAWEDLKSVFHFVYD